jgi:hypothetical protein
MLTLIWFKKIIYFSFPVISLTGLITNLLSFIIFSMKRFKNTTFSFYLKCFLTFQSLNLVLPINKMLEENFNIYFREKSNILCKFRYYYAMVNFSIASWFLAIVAIDQFMLIKFSTKFMFRKKKKFQYFLAVLIIIFNLGFYVPVWTFFAIETKLILNNDTNQTKINQICIDSSTNWFYILDMVQSVLMPFILMTMFTLLTMRIVFKSRRNTNSQNNLKSKHVRFALTSCINILIFLILNITYFIPNYFLYDSTNVFIIFETLSYIFLYINLTSTFFTYYIVNSIFRNAVKTLWFSRERR